MPDERTSTDVIKSAWMADLISMAFKIVVTLLLPAIGYCVMLLLQLKEDVAVLKISISEIRENTVMKDLYNAHLDDLKRRIEAIENGKRSKN